MMMISHHTDDGYQTDLHLQCMSTAPTLLNDLEQVWHIMDTGLFPLLVTMGHSDMPLQKDPQWRRGIYHDSYCSLAVAFIFVKMVTMDVFFRSWGTSS